MIETQTVRPPRLSAARAALQARLGAACTLALWPERAPEARMRMTLYVEQADAGDWSDALQLTGPYGTLQLSDGVRWLRALSGIDLDAGPADDPWLGGALLGALEGTPLEASATLRRGTLGPLDDECVLRWVLHSDGHSVACRARASAATWCALLAPGAWQARAATLEHLAGLPLATPIVLARHTLPEAALRALRPGDIVLPDDPAFGCDGHGRLRLGPWLAGVRHVAPHHLEITHLEPCMEQQDMDDGVAAAVADDDALAGLPVTLDFVLGRVELPLARLRELAVGSVLDVGGGSPARVAIDCGGRRLGHAEVVEVEGRLGLRVTQWGGAS